MARRNARYSGQREGNPNPASFLRILEFPESGIYTVVAFVLALTAILSLAGAGRVLWDGFPSWDSSTTILRIIERLLTVLMQVEILHTVRISIHSHVLVTTEPILIVGLIATIRRILVITLEAANLTRGETWT